MPEINLTTRKKSSAPKILGQFEKQTYKAKFSEAYQPAGHNYTQAFKVLRTAYWLKYNLLTKDDIFVYETLQLLCEMEIPFCLEVLAEKCSIGDATLRKCLDNLENADLLEIYKTDGQGTPNYYILRTPYFERESIELTDDENKNKSILKRHADIEASGGEIPETFLEDELPRLEKQIKTNRAGRLRNLAKRKFKKSKLYKNFTARLQNKKISWYRLVSRLGSNSKAATVENIIYGLSKSIPPTDSNYSIFGQRFKESLQAVGIGYTSELLEDAKSLVAFFDRHRRHKKGENATAPRIKPSAKKSIKSPVTTEREETKEFLITVLEAKRKGETSVGIPHTLQQFARMFRDALNVFSFDEIETFAAGYFLPEQWILIRQEMRC
jgi:predicted transcriptional regulator